MTEPLTSYEQHLDAARLALGRGDRGDAGAALRAAIAAAESLEDHDRLLLPALVRLGELEHDDGREAEAEALFARALAHGERALGADDPELVAPLTGLAATRIARGAPDEAEPLLVRALGIGERHLGADHPELVTLLNGLSRLYIRRSAHALAEPLLLRLLAIKRAKGEEHPEVATVLASLAVVRQALGRHDAAEQLWRRVLEIRERTLAPNHFAITTTLEHLAETCAARGRLGEALRLLRRALTMRELALDPGHPSLRAARDRIADLQLQASDDSLGADAGGTPPGTPAVLPAPFGAREPGRVVLGRLLDVMSHEPAEPVAPRVSAPAPAPRPAPPHVPPYAPPPAPPPPAASAAPAPDADAGEDGVRAFALQRLPNAAGDSTVSLAMPTFGGMTLAELQAHVDEPEAMPGRAAVALASAAALLRRTAGRAAPALASAAAFVRRRSRPAVATGAGGVALLAIALSSVSHSPARVDGMTLGDAAPAPTPRHIAQAFMPDTATVPYAGAGATLGTTVALPTATMPTVARAETASPAERPVREPEPREAGRGESRTSASEESSRAVPTRLPTLPAAVSARLDSAVRGVSSGPATLSEAYNARLATIGSNRLPGMGEDSESSRGTQPPRLVGELARAQYPTALHASGITGEVRVEFVVDTTGRVDPRSLKVVRSDHELFTTAVRRVIPGLRFSPGQTAGRKSRGTVAMRFEFAEETAAANRRP